MRIHRRADPMPSALRNEFALKGNAMTRPDADRVSTLLADYESYVSARNNKTGKTVGDYGKNYDTHVWQPVNTVHPYVQYPYKASQPGEGYADRDADFKNILYRSRKSALTSRYDKRSATRRDAFTVRRNNPEDTLKRPKKDCAKNLGIGKAVRQYCTNSSLHGLRYVGDSNLSLVERAFWVISFTLAVATAVYYIWFLYRKWVSTPIIISLSPESVPLDEFPFPSVTVCNMNNAKKTEATRINRGTDPHEKLFLEDVCNTDNATVPVDLDDDATSWNSMLRFMINVSQPCTDMLYACHWRSNQSDCEKIFNPTITDEGICCNFNSVHRKYLFYNPRDWSDLNVSYPYASIDWNPESGYQGTVPTESVPWRPYGAGLLYGLTLVLDAEVDEYYCSSTASVGFKMLLHNPVETPKIADFAFALTPGQETRVVISPRISIASRTILSIPRKKRKCFFTSERKLRYYRTYTQRNCVLECEANFTQKICECVQHYMPKSSNTPICGKKDDQCAKRARRAMEVKLYDEDSQIGQLNLTETPSCNCWPGCSEINYNVEISQSKLMSTFDIDDRYVKKSQKYFIENMAVVHLFFVDSQFTKYVKNELFGFTEFLSSTGGLLGLFMGFSFLSLMEILYFATLRLWCRLRKQNNVVEDDNRRIYHSRSTLYPFAQ